MLPKVAYILLWFPKPSETFIFHEVSQLGKMGLPLKVYSLYGELKRDLSTGMTAASGAVERVGMKSMAGLPLDVLYWWKRAPGVVKSLFATVPVRKWCDLEAAGENLWAFLCGFRLGRMAERDRIQHLHAPWANGPATAAWVASRLTGIPFSFAAHAGDIFPPDGALQDKIRECAFVRTENRANVSHLEKYADGIGEKIHVVYNGIPVRHAVSSPPSFGPPLRMLALGRFVPKKGFDVLIRSCKILSDSGLDFRLTVGGSGRERKELDRLVRMSGLEGRVDFPGFVLHQRVPDFLRSGDVFVMPSVIDASGDRDGIPTVILEALLHRLPVVASSVSGIGEIIRDGETGLLVPPGDATAVARAVLRVAANRRQALEMAEKGRLAVLEDFDVERNCRTILGLLLEHVKPLPVRASLYSGSLCRGASG